MVHLNLVFAPEFTIAAYFQRWRVTFGSVEDFMNEIEKE